jgi:hypothetical protein
VRQVTLCFHLDCGFSQATCGNPLGSSTIYAVDDASGRTSNTVTVTVTASSACSSTPPTLRVDGGTASTHQIGQTFSYTGGGFTAGKTVTRRVDPAVNGSNILLPTVGDAAGSTP